MEEIRHGKILIALLLLASFLGLSFCSPFAAFSSTVSFVSPSNSFQWFPAISANRVVYVDKRAGNLDIYLYDFQTGREIPICTHPADQYMPKIYGDRVVWMDKRNMAGKEEKWDIYMYDLREGKEIPICTSPGSHKSPSIWKDYIVWQDERNGNADVYMYDLAKGIERPICLNTGQQMYPSIDGDRIVWLDGRENFNFTDIYMYDLTLEKETPVWIHNPNRPVAAGVPAIFGDKIAYDINYDDGSAVLYLYHIATGSTSALNRVSGSAMNRSSIYHVVIYGNWVTYTLYKDGVRQVNVFDLAGGENFVPSKSLNGQDAPAIWGNTLVWQDKFGMLEKIAVTTLVQRYPPTDQFYDIGEHWSSPWVEALWEAGIIRGFDDGTFRPDSSLTRAQFAKQMADSFPLIEGKEIDFPDVNESDWFFSAVQACARSGWVKGFEDGTFRPDLPITKAEAITVLSRTASLAEVEGPLPFGDVADHWSVPYLCSFFLSDPPLLEGRFYSYLARGGSLGPDFSITRGQAAMLLASVLRLSLTP